MYEVNNKLTQENKATNFVDGVPNANGLKMIMIALASASQVVLVCYN